MRQFSCTVCKAKNPLERVVISMAGESTSLQLEPDQ